ncbi:leucine-rich repeat-containing protein 24 [Chrysoperla carnea]|uniref:leucine-rich repeat-containing protein 24 n=1 Tax=Chrysoperla carnea TaxID=189513 RepID=UPI001D08B866|nr:leucine-rich repeat-containing protein 24 [Chrysoperla carnea]
MIVIATIIATIVVPIVESASSCPSVCVCKWKGGKQNVECVNRALITIPDFVDPETQVLDMTGNNLQILPREIFNRAGLLNLQKVYLRSCRLGQIDDQAFKGLKNLVDLDLSYNLLTAVPSATFDYIPLLRELTLSNNPISKIESYAFRNVPGLVKLDLSQCELQTIAPRAFEGLDLLETLKLNNNKLTELQPRTVDSLNRLHRVELHENPWICDCRLRAAKLWLTDNNIPYPVPPVCVGGPDRILRRTFAELRVDDFACKPEILPVSRYIETTTGANATVVCRAGAVPAANVNWYWNGRLLQNNTAFSSYQKIYIFEDGHFEKRSTLILTNAQETDSSEFYCVAENRAGNAEANFTLHVSMQTAGMATLGSSQIVGLSAALVILILFILLIILVLLVRLRRMPTVETKTPGQLEVVTVVHRNGGTTTMKPVTTPIESSSFADQKLGVNTNDNNNPNCNPVQKPPRLTELSYTTANYNGGGSIMNPGTCVVSPSSTSGNNPDLINDTKREDTETSHGVMEAESERPGSGEYRNVCESLYPSGLWEQPLDGSTDKYLQRIINNSSTPGYSYDDKTPIIGEAMGMSGISSDDPDECFEQQQPQHSIINNRVHPAATSTASSGHYNTAASGYPPDYGLPIIPGGGDPNGPVPMVPPHVQMPTNAKTLRVWQKGGVPVLPPVTALKRALTSSRNSPDEGYQEGYGTDV